MIHQLFPRPKFIILPPYHTSLNQDRGYYRLCAQRRSVTKLCFIYTASEFFPYVLSNYYPIKRNYKKLLFIILKKTQFMLEYI